MAALQEYDCPSCGASLSYKPDLDQWKCDYCFSEYTQDDLDKLTQEEDSETNHQVLDSYHCNSCGAELVADPTTAATFCLYCKSSTIIKNKLKGDFQPDYVIPFKVTSEAARVKYKEWITKKFFAPKTFKEKEEIDKLTGMYAPFWLFDCQARGRIQGQATRVSTWQSGDYKYTKTKYYYVERQGQSRYEKIPVDGSNKLDDQYMTMIEPFDYTDLKPFTMQYLSGFLAEKYDVEAEACQKDMEDRAHTFLSRRLASTVTGYSSFSETLKNIDIDDVNIQYALLPIYILVNQYKDKKYVFFMNGQTGKVVGEAPLDVQKQVLFFLAVAAITWVLTVLGGGFFA